MNQVLIIHEILYEVTIINCHMPNELFLFLLKVAEEEGEDTVSFISSLWHVNGTMCGVGCSCDDRSSSQTIFSKHACMYLVVQAISLLLHCSIMY
jgi:hypothetical protein